MTTPEERLTPEMERAARTFAAGFADDAELMHRVLRELDAVRRERDEARTVTEVEGRDAAFWHNSYTMLRDAITENLGAFVKNGEEAEEAILVSAIERAATAMAKDGGA